MLKQPGCGHAFPVRPALRTALVCLLLRRTAEYSPKPLNVCRPAQVVNCSEDNEFQKVSRHRFFLGYENPQQAVAAPSGGPAMLKLKDWPPQSEFAKELIRHNQVLLRAQA